MGKCTNTPGSFKCSCHDGWIGFGTSTYKCKDLDECLTSKHTCGKYSRCINTVGSYKCPCNKGYELIRGKGCLDIDECIVRDHQHDNFIFEELFDLHPSRAFFGSLISSPW